MVTRVLITLHILHAVLHAAQPAERPWPRRPGRPAADATPTAPPPPPVGGDGPHRPGPVSEVISASAPTGGTRRGGRGASRRRGRRGGANWRRHGDTESHQLIIGQLNIQSYKPKLPDLRQDIDGVYGFDVLALCETWLTPNVPDRLIGVSGYKLFRGDRPTRLSLPKGKGGVAVLVRDSLSCELLPTPPGVFRLHAVGGVDLEDIPRVYPGAGRLRRRGTKRKTRALSGVRLEVAARRHRRSPGPPPHRMLLTTAIAAGLGAAASHAAAPAR